MSKLFKHCEEIKHHGGIFYPRFCPLSLKLTGYSSQNALELALANKYGRKIFFLDSTHNCTRHYLKVCPPSGIDCFGFQCGFGLTTFDVEASQDVKICLVDLSLNKKGAVAGVGRAPGWDEPFALFEIIKVHDTWHFGKDVTTGGSGLADKFKADKNKSNKAMNCDFWTTEKLGFIFEGVS